MPTALVLGGNGQVGSAAARALLTTGWHVTCSGRSAERFPADLRETGARFVRSDRHVAAELGDLLASGADVVVDCVGYTAEHARMLLPLRAGFESLVFISSKAVHVDARGNHSNSDEPPRFDGPVTEEQATMAPSDVDHDSREGYGAKTPRTAWPSPGPSRPTWDKAGSRSCSATVLPRASGHTPGTPCRRTCSTPPPRPGSGSRRSALTPRPSVQRSTGLSRPSGRATPAGCLRPPTTSTSAGSSTTPARTPGWPGGRRELPLPDQRGQSAT